VGKIISNEAAIISRASTGSKITICGCFTCTILHFQTTWPTRVNRTNNVQPRTGLGGAERKKYITTFSLTSALDGGGWSTPHPVSFTPGKESQCPVYRRLGGLQGRSGRVREISLPPVSHFRTVQPVANRYAAWAIPACTIRNRLGLRSRKLCLSTLRVGRSGERIQMGRDFPHPSKPDLRPTQPPILLVPGLSRG